MSLTFADLNDHVLFNIVELLDIKSCVNLALSCKYFRNFFSSYPLQKSMKKKLQRYLVDIMHECYFLEDGGFMKFSSFHHLCNSLFSHLTHMAHVYNVLKSGNYAKKKIIVELILKTMSLQTSGLNIFPPVDVNQNQDTWINHWFCFEVGPGRYIFLINTTNKVGWYKKEKHSSRKFVSGIIHHPYSVEERCQYFACENDPICEWDGLIAECW